MPGRSRYLYTVWFFCCILLNRINFSVEAVAAITETMKAIRKSHAAFYAVIMSPSLLVANTCRSSIVVCCRSLSKRTRALFFRALNVKHASYKIVVITVHQCCIKISYSVRSISYWFVLVQIAYLQPSRLQQKAQTGKPFSS